MAHKEEREVDLNEIKRFFDITRGWTGLSLSQLVKLERSRFNPYSK